MYHFTNHQIYHQNPYPQQCPIFIDHTKHPTSGPIVHHVEPVVSEQVVSIHPDNTQALLEPQTQTTPSLTNKKKKTVTNKSCVDTSHFSIEERLVAAVWVHERKHTKNSMSQIKHDFRQRFGREPPAKNTLLVWERKLFSTGSVHNAPRPGRPVNRRHRMDEVAASVRTAPSLSLRARALALRLPRTTLRTILHKDLSNTTTGIKSNGQNILNGKQASRTTIKRQIKRKLVQQVEENMASAVQSHPHQHNEYI